jgi:hypothetical protein
MTAKEKAQQLVERFEGNVKYALIAVDEIIDECYNWAGGGGNIDWEKSRWDYFQEVKQEIEKK